MVRFFAQLTWMNRLDLALSPPTPHASEPLYVLQERKVTENLVAPLSPRGLVDSEFAFLFDEQEGSNHTSNGCITRICLAAATNVEIDIDTVTLA